MKHYRTLLLLITVTLVVLCAGCRAAGLTGRQAVTAPPVSENTVATVTDNGFPRRRPPPPDSAAGATLEERYTRLLREINAETVPDPGLLPPADFVAPPPPPPPDRITVPAKPALPPPDLAVATPAAPVTGEPVTPPPAGSVPLTIQPEAVLRIRVQEDPSLDGQYPVNEIGAVNLGYVGPIILFNRTAEQAAEKIREVLFSRDFRNATVTVEILRASYDRVAVGGHVNRPGSIRIGAGDTISLNDALLRVGGLKGTVRGMQVRIVRGGLTNVLAAVQEGDVYELQTEDGRPFVPAVRLSNNDKVTVFSSRQAPAAYGDKEILVLGEVHRQGPVRFAGDEPSTMMRLVFRMGGFPPYANRRAVRIIRRDEKGIEREMTVNVERIMATGDPDDDVPLEHGDRIIVPARRISLF